MQFRSYKKYFTREYLSKRTVLFSFSSLLLNFLNGIAKIVLSIFNFSLYFCLNGAYNVVLASAKSTAIKKYNSSKKCASKELQERKEIKTCYNLSVFAICISLLYFLFSFLITFFYTDHANYSTPVAIYIATVAFSKLILSIISSTKTKGDDDIIIHHIKLLNLADACVSIGLTQRALLFLNHVQNANLYSGIGGICFSFIALIISIYMIIELKKKKKRTT